MSPNTGIGMCVAITTCISGVLVMSLPVPIIVNNFSAFYHNTKRVEVTVQRRADKKAMQIEEEQQRLKIEREENIKLLESGININWFVLVKYWHSMHVFNFSSSILISKFTALTFSMYGEFKTEYRSKNINFWFKLELKVCSFKICESPVLKMVNN